MKKTDNKKLISVPHKRPQQARAVFTVQTIYDGFLSLWKNNQHGTVTTRAIAEITGFSVGAIYEYFPNNQAILSGYIRYLIDDLIERINLDAQQLTSAPWQQRLGDLLAMTLGLDVQAKYIDRAMLLEEGTIAFSQHHRLAFERLSAAWKNHILSWRDLTLQPNNATINTLFVTTWGSRRYLLLADVGSDEVEGIVEKLQTMCESLLQ
jgi:AcrR family transcriptional regulator